MTMAEMLSQISIPTVGSVAFIAALGAMYAPRGARPMLATSALKCDVGPEARISQLFEHPVPGEVLIIDPTDGKMVRVGAPFIIRENDAQWHQLMAVLKLSAELRSTAP